MNFTFRLLSQGDNKVLGYYEKAKIIWDKTLNGYDGKSRELAPKLKLIQKEFEDIIKENNFLGLDKYDAYELMVFSGLNYYLDSYDENTKKYEYAVSIAEAFELSYCSSTVKFLSKRLSNFLNIDSRIGIL